MLEATTINSGGSFALVWTFSDGVNQPRSGGILVAPRRKPQGITSR